MLTVFDCSNSSERQKHRKEFLGNRENDIVIGLKKYAHIFGFRFVSDPNRADIIFTNDVFPENIKRMEAVKIKRMDGIFWQQKDKHKNDALNESAQIADKVIFISEFSKKSLKQLYNIEIEGSVVIVNNVDDSIFKQQTNVRKHDSFTWIASASDWNRPEKRFNAILNFAEIVDPYDRIVLIGGKPDNSIRKNIKMLGYITDYNLLCRYLNMCHAFVNFSYRDSAPKVVCQALHCGLPVLYADSGGVRELVRDNGIGIKEKNSLTYIPKLENMRKEYQEFKMRFYKKKIHIQSTFINTMSLYFAEFERAWVKKCGSKTLGSIRLKTRGHHR